jgi:hypothetical protein
LRRSADHIEATAFVWRELVRLLQDEGVATWNAGARWIGSRRRRENRRRIVHDCSLTGAGQFCQSLKTLARPAGLEPAISWWFVAGKIMLAAACCTFRLFVESRVSIEVAGERNNTRTNLSKDYVERHGFSFR